MELLNQVTGEDYFKMVLGIIDKFNIDHFATDTNHIPDIEIQGLKSF